MGGERWFTYAVWVDGVGYEGMLGMNGIDRMAWEEQARMDGWDRWGMDKKEWFARADGWMGRMEGKVG